MSAVPTSKRGLSSVLIACAFLALALPTAGAQSVGPSAPGGLVATVGPGAGEATLTWEPASDGACSMASPWPAEAPRCLSLA